MRHVGPSFSSASSSASVADDESRRREDAELQARDLLDGDAVGPEFSGVALDVLEVLNHHDAAGLEDARDLRDRARPAGLSWTL